MDAWQGLEDEQWVLLLWLLEILMTGECWALRERFLLVYSFFKALE